YDLRESRRVVPHRQSGTASRGGGLAGGGYQNHWCATSGRDWPERPMGAHGRRGWRSRLRPGGGFEPADRRTLQSGKGTRQRRRGPEKAPCSLKWGAAVKSTDSSAAKGAMVETR